MPRNFWALWVSLVETCVIVRVECGGSRTSCGFVRDGCALCNSVHVASVSSRFLRLLYASLLLLELEPAPSSATSLVLTFRCGL
ncbi:hypothetical protein B0H13DRAFT_1033887 [Mycena leptocephala]|nr:hypothetical protein B0H13DRAFT_1033887 [Mycena leptocephala]